MELDFSGLISIAQKNAQEDFSEPFNAEGIDFPVEVQKPSEGTLEAQRGQEPDALAHIKLQREQEDHRNAVEMYGAYQSNIQRAGTLRTDIMRGIKAGDAPQALLLKAVKCIALMTGDKLFYDQTEADIKAVWGEGFLDPLSLDLVLEEVEERIANMERAVKREGTGSDSRERIERALKTHYRKREELRALLEKPEEDIEVMRAGA